MILPRQDRTYTQFKRIMEYLTNGQQFPMVCTLIDHRNDINIFKTMQCSTYVWNILMLHVFLWLIRVQTMENCFRYVFYHNTDSFDVYFYRSISQNREEKCDVMLPWKHYFWMTTKPMTMAVARRMAKNMFISTNNNFARARCFVFFFAVFAPLQHETS